MEEEKWTKIHGHIVAPEGIDLGGNNLWVEGNIMLWKSEHIINHIVNQVGLSHEDATAAYRIVTGDWPVSVSESVEGLEYMLDKIRGKSWYEDRFDRNFRWNDEEDE